jgi:hypothetical protein
MGSLSPYVEVQNLFNDRWISFGAVSDASPEDQRAFVDSGFEDLPEVTDNGTPIFDLAFYRNLPRSVVFGLSFSF